MASSPPTIPAPPNQVSPSAGAVELPPPGNAAAHAALAALQNTGLPLLLPMPNPPNHAGPLPLLPLLGPDPPVVTPLVPPPVAPPIPPPPAPILPAGPAQRPAQPTLRFICTMTTAERLAQIDIPAVYDDFCVEAEVVKNDLDKEATGAMIELRADGEENPDNARENLRKHIQIRTAATTDSVSHLDFLGLRLIKKQMRRRNANGGKDPVAIIAGRPFRTKKHALYWTACYKRARSAMGTSIDEAQHYADRETRLFVAMRYGGVTLTEI